MAFTDESGQLRQALQQVLSDMEQHVARAITDMQNSLEREIRLFGDKLDRCIAKTEEIIASLPHDDNQSHDL
jgi:hypothetical protein